MAAVGTCWKECWPHHQQTWMKCANRNEIILFEHPERARNGQSINISFSVTVCVSGGHIIFRPTKYCSKAKFTHANHPSSILFINLVFGPTVHFVHCIHYTHVSKSKIKTDEQRLQTKPHSFFRHIHKFSICLLQFMI